ncbi:SDR family oxidoreductase [Pseudonocardia sp. RS11V-5]|uniref:SDR family NAD(P)-dependent oxidoreductase n=1 Tax=Pseudonocardia terrae TaxID=2905831 RepID=UPI001E54CBA0|nr:SDR family NAD(P)-dependent oxidoreductase [Pseudonocardia terrae]MCE3551109.1 SDR family oxidoreductase [Pseudonocardia terrae]
MIDFGLAGTVVAVTGGGSGIGRSIAEFAGAHGVRVAVIDRDESAAKSVAADLPDARAYTLDVRDPEETDAVFTAVERELGPLHGAVTCAGVSLPGVADRLSHERWSTVLDVNLTGTFLSLQAAGRRMLPRGAGALVAVGSVDSFGGHGERANYAASKAGIAGVVRSMAIDWGPRGVRVNAIAPGAVDTPLLRRNIPADVIRDTMVARTPLGRLSTGADQAAAALFLLSDAAAYVTGVLLPVDGGTTAGYFTHIAPAGDGPAPDDGAARSPGLPAGR